MNARQRQLAVTAEQLRGDDAPLPMGVRRTYVENSRCGRDDGHPDGWALGTGYSSVRVSRGDWVLTWPDGSRTACSDAHFTTFFEVAA